MRAERGGISGKNAQHSPGLQGDNLGAHGLCVSITVPRRLAGCRCT
jgi:hypothetical protein